MRYLRFTLNDDNLTKTGDELVWELPLNLEKRKVGLSSLSMDLQEVYDSSDKMFLTVTCNLMDHSMESAFHSTSMDTGN